MVLAFLGKRLDSAPEILDHGDANNGCCTNLDTYLGRLLRNVRGGGNC